MEPDHRELRWTPNIQAPWPVSASFITHSVVILLVILQCSDISSAFGTCIQKYVIERYVCLIVFMLVAQTHVQAVATVH